MSRIKLKFNSISEIVGNGDIGLLVLTDEEEKRQLTITCDKFMLHEFSMRTIKPGITKNRLPEAVGQVLDDAGMDVEIHIYDIVDGEYKATIFDNISLSSTKIRVSDAILLATTCNLPIYAEDELMQTQSVKYVKGLNKMSLPINALTDEMLKISLDNAIKDENYEIAQYISEEIKRRKLKK
jgi:bifunctional DNase/RNase